MRQYHDDKRMPDLATFITGLPKAELHLHIEGSLEPELMFALAQRNGVAIPFASVEEVRAAYSFTRLQDFLDIYYQGANVLLTREDFRDLAIAYFDRAAADGVVHAEIMFDPQTHLARGVAFETVITGLLDGIADAGARHGMSAALILCFLRHLDEADAFATLEAARPWLDRIAAVGLDSSELGPRPRNSPASSPRRAPPGCGWWRMPARRGHRTMSIRRSTCSASTGSTTATAASRTRCSPRGWRAPA